MIFQRSVSRYLLGEDNWAEFLSEHLLQHGHQFFMVQVLHPVEMVEVQKHHLSGVSWQETTYLLETFSHLKKKSRKHLYQTIQDVRKQSGCGLIANVWKTLCV